VVLLESTEALSHLLSFCGRPNWHKTLQAQISNKHVTNKNKFPKIVYGQAHTFFSSTTGAGEGLAAEGSSGGNPCLRLLSACHNRQTM